LGFVSVFDIRISDFERLPDVTRSALLLCIIWVLLLAAWTVALLHPHPVDLDDDDLTPDVKFYVAKAVHVSAYALSAVLTAALPIDRRWRRVLLALLGLHAGATEWLQTFIPPRTGSLRDVLLDLLGLALGVIVTRRRW
jgi:VanZ family protein